MNSMQSVTGAAIELHARLSEIAGEDVYVEAGRTGAVLHASRTALTRVAAHFGFKYSSASASRFGSDPRMFITAAKWRSVNS